MVRVQTINFYHNVKFMLCAKFSTCIISINLATLLQLRMYSSYFLKTVSTLPLNILSLCVADTPSLLVLMLQRAPWTRRNEKGTKEICEVFPTERYISQERWSVMTTSGLPWQRARD